MDFSYRTRAKRIDHMPHESYDMLVIGGGITGCGIALDATLRGLKVALIDQGDFAGGTSSRSTKLVHGGLRYLAQGEVSLVREAGSERNALLNIAPHLVTPMPFIIPTYQNWLGAMTYYPMTFGLWLYDRLAHVRPHERRVMLSPDQVKQAEPLLAEQPVTGGGRYYEYVTDDARLTLEVAKTAHEHGGHLINYVEMTDLLIEDGQCQGARVRDVLNDTAWTIRAATVVNAAGPWVDQVRRKDTVEPRGKRLYHTKGIHLVFDRGALPVSQAVTLLPDDGRIVFVIPHGKFTYVGTTDTEYKGDLRQPYPDPEDVDYLLNVLNELLSGGPLAWEHVLSSWAGIRPLIYEEGKGPNEISRADELMTSETGLISIAGGKLTAYRKMAERVVDYVVSVLQKKGLAQDANPCETFTKPVSGMEGIASHFRAFYLEKTAELQERGWPAETAERIVQTYGRHADTVVGFVAESTEEIHHPLHRDLLAADVRYAVQHEMALTVCDVLERRHPLFLFSHDQGRSVIQAVTEMMGRLMGWDEARRSVEMTQAHESVALRNRWRESERKK